MEKDKSGNPENHESVTEDSVIENHNTDAALNGSNNTDRECGPDEVRRRKQILNRLKIFDKQQLRYPNRLKHMVLRPLIFLSFPVISYAGFSYGSYLVWYNVLNGTSSLILSGKPYRFSSSIVGLAYLSPLIGMTFA